MEQGNAETCLVVSRNGEIKGSFFSCWSNGPALNIGVLSPYDVGTRWLLVLHGVEKSKRRSLSSRPHGAPWNVHSYQESTANDVGTPQIFFL